jgi:hypothetical protein
LIPVSCCLFDECLARAKCSITIGISRAYGGVLSALSITYTLTPLDKPPVASETRWKERETVVALYVDHEEVLAVDERVIVGDLALS